MSAIRERAISVLDVMAGQRLISEYVESRLASMSDKQQAASSNVRTLQWHHLMLIIYFNAIGGPFGLEPAIGAAGPLLTYVLARACSTPC